MKKSILTLFCVASIFIACSEGEGTSITEKTVDSVVIQLGKPDENGFCEVILAIPREKPITEYVPANVKTHSKKVIPETLSCDLKESCVPIFTKETQEFAKFVDKGLFCDGQFAITEGGVRTAKTTGIQKIKITTVTIRTWLLGKPIENISDEDDGDEEPSDGEIPGAGGNEGPGSINDGIIELPVRYFIVEMFAAKNLSMTAIAYNKSAEISRVEVADEADYLVQKAALEASLVFGETLEERNISAVDEIHRTYIKTVYEDSLALSQGVHKLSSLADFTYIPTHWCDDESQAVKIIVNHGGVDFYLNFDVFLDSDQITYCSFITANSEREALPNKEGDYFRMPTGSYPKNPQNTPPPPPPVP